MNRYNFKSFVEKEEELLKNKKYDFTPCKECIKKESQIDKDKIVILEKNE